MITIAPLQTPTQSPKAAKTIPALQVLATQAIKANQLPAKILKHLLLKVLIQAANHLQQIPQNQL